MAVKIKLKRMGKMRNPQYRIVVADARTKRDGRAIEEIGTYHPKEDPSLIQVDSERAQYWLGVGAQPTEAVAAILKVTGDWQKFKGLPGAEGTLQVRGAQGRQEGRVRGCRQGAGRRAARRGRHAAAKKAPAKQASRPAEAARRPPRRVAESVEPPARRAAEVAEPVAEPMSSRSSRPAAETRRRRRGRDAGRGRGGSAEAGRRGRRSERAGLMLEEALEHLVRGIVEHPDDVPSVTAQLRRGRVLEVRVHPDDMGKVIGRAGRTAKALRTVLGALSPGTASASTSSTSTRLRVDAVQVVVGRIGRAHGIHGRGQRRRAHRRARSAGCARGGPAHRPRGAPAR